MSPRLVASERSGDKVQHGFALCASVSLWFAASFPSWLEFEIWSFSEAWTLGIWIFERVPAWVIRCSMFIPVPSSASKVLSFFAISVILALFGIFLPDPCLWVRDSLAGRKFRSNK